MNYSGILQVIDLWYDWPNGRNFNIIQHQLGNVLYDLEWNNGTSFFYTLDSSKTCSSAHVEVGILRPNWLEGATYLGQQHVDGFLCNVWEKVEFIWYFEDVVTKRPVHWVFYTGREAHVMTFEVGAVLEDSKWQAPVYCFHNTTASTDSTSRRLLDGVLKGYYYTNITVAGADLPFHARVNHVDGLDSVCMNHLNHWIQLDMNKRNSLKGIPNFRFNKRILEL
ncbi:hypothetical protein GOBAR_DD26948 [Gossypium barbadense]|nr:hypothetical protein GOBAR_DD26948 [Gossypium barbadense]